MGKPFEVRRAAAATIRTAFGGYTPEHVVTAMPAGNAQIAERVPGARHAEIPGATHLLKPRRSRRT